LGQFLGHGEAPFGGGQFQGDRQLVDDRAAAKLYSDLYQQATHGDVCALTKRDNVAKEWKQYQPGSNAEAQATRILGALEIIDHSAANFIRQQESKRRS
jgi:hypothetical protein